MFRIQLSHIKPETSRHQASCFLAMSKVVVCFAGWADERSILVRVPTVHLLPQVSNFDRKLSGHGDALFHFAATLDIVVDKGVDVGIAISVAIVIGVYMGAEVGVCMGVLILVRLGGFVSVVAEVGMGIWISAQIGAGVGVCVYVLDEWEWASGLV